MRNGIKGKEIFTARFTEVVDQNGGQTEVARRLGIPRNTIGNWCRGRSFPSADNILYICNALDVSADYLVGRVDFQSTNPSIVELCNLTGLNETGLNSMVTLSKRINDLSATRESFQDMIEFLLIYDKFCHYKRKERVNE